MKLDERIRELRQARGLSQVDVAKAMGVTKQSASNWENNNIQPSIEVLIRLARYFYVSTDYMLGLDDRKYLEVTDLSDREVTHIQQIIEDIKGK